MKIRRLKHSQFKQLLSDLRMSLVYIKYNLIQAAELRFSFYMQVVGMMVNNTAFLFVWIFFFQAFGTINGWSAYEVVALQGFIAVIYGFTFSLFAGASELPSVINTGVFDTVLLTPRNLYFRILTLVTRTSAIGDMIYGVILLIFYSTTANISFIQLVLLVSLLIPTTLIITNFALITSCIGFFIPDSDELSKNTFELMFGPSMFPSGMFQGSSRFFFLFILPSIAIGGLPVEAVSSLNFTKILIVWIIAFGWSLASIFVLKQGLRRYESGNLTGARI